MECISDHESYWSVLYFCMQLLQWLTLCHTLYCLFQGFKRYVTVIPHVLRRYIRTIYGDGLLPLSIYKQESIGLSLLSYIFSVLFSLVNKISSNIILSFCVICVLSMECSKWERCEQCVICKYIYIFHNNVNNLSLT